MTPVFAGFVGSRCYHAPGLGTAADKQGLALQIRVLEFLYGRIERIEINESDIALVIHAVMVDDLGGLVLASKAERPPLRVVSSVARCESGCAD
jgi:hypothetical protein